jgi:hypothetical protein
MLAPHMPDQRREGVVRRGAARDEGEAAVSCACPEYADDQILYGIHACKDGKRIDPRDLLPEPTKRGRR